MSANLGSNARAQSIKGVCAVAFRHSDCATWLVGFSCSLGRRKMRSEKSFLCTRAGSKSWMQLMQQSPADLCAIAVPQARKRQHMWALQRLTGKAANHAALRTLRIAAPLWTGQRHHDWQSESIPKARCINGTAGPHFAKCYWTYQGLLCYVEQACRAKWQSLLDPVHRVAPLGLNNIMEHHAHTEPS